MTETEASMQRRVLVRVKGLAAFRRALVDLALAGTPIDARRRVVIVPTRAAGELLRQTGERRRLSAASPAVVLPDFLTRDEWVRRCHEALGAARRLLSRTEREVLLERAWRETARAHPLAAPLFDLRPGLVGAMLDFYDELRRRRRSVPRAVRALFDELRVERGMDRGSDDLIQQTRCLGYAFLAYERAAGQSSGMDEHELRLRLIAEQPPLPFTHVVVAVADHPSDPRGLWPVDFDLLGRLPELRRLEIVVTDEAHDAGFRERIELELPGLEERRGLDEPRAPVLVRPAGAGETPAVVCRDREDELRHVVRTIRQDAGGALDASVAVVFQRPLPYLYLAQQVLGEARVPYQAFDALPLAAEPYTAVLDLVLSVARTGGTRSSVIALLGATLLAFEVDGRLLDARDVGALDAVLAARRETGDAASYVEAADGYFRSAAADRRLPEAGVRRAAAAAADLHRELEPFRTASSGSMQVGAIGDFLRRHERGSYGDDRWRDRWLRARGAVLGVLDELAEACREHDDRRRDPDALVSAVRHAIEARTFTPRRGTAGVHLVDAVAARFGDFDHVHLVGLVETDWPDRLKRGIFYGAELLKRLGWPQPSDHARAEQAAFNDLLALPDRSLRLSAFQFEGDAVVTLSPLLERVRGQGLEAAAPPPASPLFADEVLMRAVDPASLEEEPGAWLRLRRRRPPLTDARYSGLVDPRSPQVYRVSRVDQYVSCPFRYFADSVLKLPEEREELAGLTPLERGLLLHGLFEAFYREWQARAQGGITPENLPDAMTLFADLARQAIGRLPEADRALEEVRLLGSLVGLGVAERVFELEADSGATVEERLLECDLRGPFRFPVLHGLTERTIEIHGKADRIDVLGDGSLRVVDYKLGRMPDLKSSIQIAVYAYAASQQLAALHGQPHPVSSAMYLAFGDDRRVDGALGGPPDPVDLAVRARASTFAAAVEDIEAGRFPPRPRRPADCQWCGYAGVCRKEYRGESDEAADAV
ncbi:MAG: PD-(D/E)XK nuclease family protein [Acidobacteria bacterium]|nr:PD-(D/E)XK nuclease family protein [Acidobacteriota bacterium]